MILGALRSPRATLEAAARERRVWAAARVVGFWALLNLLLTEAFVLGGGVREQDALPVLKVFAPVSAVLLPFVWWIGVAALMQLSTRLFDGRVSLSSMLAAVGAACAPWVIGYAIQLPVGALQLVQANQGGSPALGAVAFAVSAGSLVWHVVLVVMAGKLAAGTDYRGAGASCALAGAGCATAAVIFGITILAMIFTLSGAGV